MSVHIHPSILQAPPCTQADIEAMESAPWQDKVFARTTYDVLRLAAARHHHHTALRFVVRGEPDSPAFSLSYRFLFERVTQAANAFHYAGIQPDQAVAILLPNLLETHIALWGAQAAGIANPINPMLDIAHIAAIINATQAQALVTLAPSPGSDIWEKAMAVVRQCRSIHTVFVVNLDSYLDPERPVEQKVPRADEQPLLRDSCRIVSFNDALNQEPSDSLVSSRDISPDDVCAYFHTGGTTGLPKIALHTHQNEVFISSMLPQLLPEHQVVLCGLPLFHVNGAMVTGLGAFHGGWEVVILTPHGFRGKGVLPNFWKFVRRFGATTFSAVPTVFASLANVPPEGTDISTLRHALCGAAPLPREVARRFEEIAGIPLCEGYGLTEGTCISTVNPINDARHVGTVGLRLPHQALKAWKVDSSGKATVPCATGEVGVIGISGPNVFPGYLHERDNEGIWLEHGWLNTGDLGYIDEEGFLHLTGRAKDLIIRGGHNIDPAMIEDALHHHPAVEKVAAVGQPDLHAGELPMAFVTLKPNFAVDADELHAYASEHIPERAAVPVRIITLDQMPLTAIGKIAKAELRHMAAQTVFHQILLEHGISAELTVFSEAARGNVVKLKCSQSDAPKAIELLTSLDYSVDVLPLTGKE